MLDILLSMDRQERAHVLGEELLSIEIAWLKFIIASMKKTDEHIALYTERARFYAQVVEEYPDAPDAAKSLELAEMCMKHIAHLKEHRYTLKDVRKQREKIQCLKRSLKRKLK